MNFKSPADRAQEKIDEMYAAGAPAGAEPPVEAILTPVIAPEPLAVQIPAPVVAPADQNDSTFKARWETLQGMHRTLKEENSFLQHRVNTLETQVSELSNAAPQAPAPAGNMSEILASLSEEVGADLAGKIQQLIHETNAAQIAPVTQQLATVASDSLRTRQQNFSASLGAQVPNWSTVMNSPAFGMWLDSNAEQFSGLSFRACFDRANDNWDLPGLVGIFQKFSGPAAPVPVIPPVDPRLALVSPGKGGGGGATDLTPTEKYFKESEVNAFYKDVTLGRYRGRAAEQTQMDALIQQANQAGRIIPG